MIRKCQSCGCQIQPKVTNNGDVPVVTCPVCGVEMSPDRWKQVLKLVGIGLGIWFLVFVYQLMTSQFKLFLG